jgi:vitamin B12 transporter
VGGARRQGVEIQFEHVLNAFVRSSWNYTYLENTGTPSGVDHPVLLAYSPRHTANVTAVITPSKRWEIDPTLRYEDARFSGNDRAGTKLGSQLIMDLRIAYQWRQLELFLGVKDLTDKRYEEVSGYPLPGRTAYAGVRLRLWG